MTIDEGSLDFEYDKGYDKGWADAKIRLIQEEIDWMNKIFETPSKLIGKYFMDRLNMLKKQRDALEKENGNGK